MKTGTSLDLSTPSEREIIIRRHFDAPRRLVFDAFTKPELVRRWLTGPDGWYFVTCDIDLRVGGTYRYLWAKEGQPQMGMRGVFREVTPPERIVSSEVFDEPWYPGEGLVSITLTERDGGTLLTELIRYESQVARDLVLRSGMAEGVKAGFDRLAELLESHPAEDPN